MNTNMEQTEATAIEIISQYFKPITGQSNPETPEQTPESSQNTQSSQNSLSSEYDSPTDSDINGIARLGVGADTVDTPMNDVTPELINGNEKTGMNSFINEYGLAGAARIFDSIDQYPPEKMLQILHSYEKEMKRVKKSYHHLLVNEITKLRYQINQQEQKYQNYLINIILNCPESNQHKIEIQKQFLTETTTLDQLVDTVLKMKDRRDLLQYRLDLKRFIEENNFTNRKAGPVFQKLSRELTWSLVQSFRVAHIEPETLKWDCVICTSDPAECVITPCGHKCLCLYCKSLVEKNDEPTCPICRCKITQVIKIFE